MCGATWFRLQGLDFLGRFCFSEGTWDGLSAAGAVKGGAFFAQDQIQEEPGHWRLQRREPANARLWYVGPSVRRQRLLCFP